jgi:hypothetical protein
MELDSLDFGAAPPDMPEVEAKVVKKTIEQVKYSPIVRMGLFFSVRPCFSSMLL